MSPPRTYLYQLRRGDEIIATGQLTLEQTPKIGEPLSIAGREGIIRSITPGLAHNKPRLTIQLSTKA